MSFSAKLYNISDDPRSLAKTLGEAIISAARTRPKYIGGERAKYE